MRYPYVVILKKSSERATDLLSLLLCLFSVIYFTFFAASSFHRPEWGPATGYLLLIAAGALLTGMAINFVMRRRRQVRYRYLLFGAAVGWLVLPYTLWPWVSVLYFLLALLEPQAKRPLEIGFGNDHIVINSLIKRRFTWADLTNVVLKDGLLTLDFANNRLIQREVADDEDEDDADEDEFNAWCRERLKTEPR